MAEPMTVRVEVWPVAADSAGIWLVSGDDAWRDTLPVAADSEPHAEAKLLIGGHGAGGDDVLLHSTSWRPDGGSVVLTYVAVLRRPGLVLDNWPDARPVGCELATAVGKPPAHAAAGVPVPRYVDVLLHALRHLRMLRDTDAVARNALDATWQRHLDDLAPALAGMYEDQMT